MHPADQSSLFPSWCSDSFQELNDSPKEFDFFDFELNRENESEEFHLIHDNQNTYNHSFNFGLELECQNEHTQIRKELNESLPDENHTMNSTPQAYTRIDQINQSNLIDQNFPFDLPTQLWQTSNGKQKSTTNNYSLSSDAERFKNDLYKYVLQDIEGKNHLSKKLVIKLFNKIRLSLNLREASRMEKRVIGLFFQNFAQYREIIINYIQMNKDIVEEIKKEVLKSKTKKKKKIIYT